MYPSVLILINLSHGVLNRHFKVDLLSKRAEQVFTFTEKKIRFLFIKPVASLDNVPFCRLLIEYILYKLIVKGHCI